MQGTEQQTPKANDEDFDKLDVVINKECQPQMKQPIIAVRSKHVWISEKQAFIEATVLIEEGFIKEVIFVKQDDETRQLPSNIKLTDYGELYILPGLIDMNVSLHVGTEWEDVRDTTRLFAAGGVTTIVCQPFLSPTDTILNSSDELKSLETKKLLIKGQSAVDYCFLANLNEDNLESIEKIYQTPGVIGFKVCLNPPVQAGAGWVKTKKSMARVTEAVSDLRKILGAEQVNSPHRKLTATDYPQPEILLAFHAIKSGGKELTITSPLREQSIDFRLHLESEIKQTEGDSVLGEVGKKVKSKKSNGTSRHENSEGENDGGGQDDEEDEEEQLSV